MRFNRLDLNLLVALDALLSEQNISRAAEKVHLSQSTMSHALARLREHFNDELLVQVGRRMELTPRAESLRDPIRDVLVRISTTIDTAPEFDPSKSDREFVLLVSDYSMAMLFPHVFALADEQRSRVRVKLLPQTGDSFRALERGELDLLVIPEPFCAIEHPHEVLFEEDYTVVMWKKSSLAQSEMTIDRYVQARHVVMEPPGSAQPAYENWLVQRYGISRQVQVTSYSFATIPAMLVGTQMIATIQARLARQIAQLYPLKCVPLPVELPRLVQTMQWHKHRSQDPGLAWLRSLLKQAVLRMDESMQSKDLVTVT